MALLFFVFPSTYALFFKYIISNPIPEPRHSFNQFIIIEVLVLLAIKNTPLDNFIQRGRTVYLFYKRYIFISSHNELRFLYFINRISAAHHSLYMCCSRPFLLPYLDGKPGMYCQLQNQSSRLYLLTV